MKRIETKNEQTIIREDVEGGRRRGIPIISNRPTYQTEGLVEFILETDRYNNFQNMHAGRSSAFDNSTIFIMEGINSPGKTKKLMSIDTNNNDLPELADDFLLPHEIMAMNEPLDFKPVEDGLIEEEQFEMEDLEIESFLKP